MKDRNTLINIIIIIFLIGIGYKVFFPKKEKPVSYDYDTQFKEMKESFDTRFREIAREIRNFEQAKPLIVKEYHTEQPIYNITKLTDSIIYIGDSLDNKLEVSTDYLTKWPKNDKLIFFTLDGDSLNLGTLSIDGISREKNWPMDFDNYSYIYADNELNYVSKGGFNLGRRTPLDFSQLYLSGGYDFLRGSPHIGSEYYLDIKRLRLSGDMKFYLEQKPIGQASIKLGYKLFK